MKITTLLILLLALALPARAATVTVFAAASLTDALKTIGQTYEKKTGDKIVYSFLGSNVLARQIEEGAPADIFFSADEAQMENLAKAGLIDPASRKDVVRNQLVIVAPSDSPLHDFVPTDLAKPDIQRIALADPQAVPAGVYAKAYLTKLGLWSKLERKIVPTANVRAALAAVESANAETGIIYKTDVAMSKSAKILYAVPLAAAPRITYPAAMIKASGSAAAKKFLAYLESAETQAVFRRDGFLTSGD